MSKLEILIISIIGGIISGVIVGVILQNLYDSPELYISCIKESQDKSLQITIQNEGKPAINTIIYFSFYESGKKWGTYSLKEISQVGREMFEENFDLSSYEKDFKNKTLYLEVYCENCENSVNYGSECRLPFIF